MNKYMEIALEEANKALQEGEVPVGAVIVLDGQVVGRGHNQTEDHGDPTCHAEMMAIRDAVKNTGSQRLQGASMYVTLEPCPMCAGALVLSRIDRLYIGAMDPKAGACGSIFDLVDSPKLNHRITVETGILEDQCGAMLRDFFRELRV